MPQVLKTEENLVKGCQSSVWFDIRCENGKINFDADSDSLIVKGIVAIVDYLYNGQSAEDVLKADLSIFEELGLWQHLSSQRGNGLMAMLAHLKKSRNGLLKPVAHWAENRRNIKSVYNINHESK